MTSEPLSNYVEANKPYVVVVSNTIPACRSGWIGAWDAIKAAWYKDRRTTAPESITLWVTLMPKVDSYVVGPPGSVIFSQEVPELEEHFTQPKEAI